MTRHNWKNNKIRQVTTEIKKAVINNLKNSEMLMEMYLEKKRRMHEMKKNTANKNKWTPPLFDKNDIAKAVNVNKKKIKPNFIKKVYEDDSNSLPAQNSFLQKSAFKTSKQEPVEVEYTTNSVYLFNKEIINYPHYGNVGEQVIFNTIPDYTNKKYLPIH